MAPTTQYSRSILRRVIGVLAGPLTRKANPAGETTLGDVFADALQAGAAPFDLNQAALADLADLLSPFGGPAGRQVRLTVADALRAVPLRIGSSVVTLTGEELHQALETQFAGHRTAIMQVSSQLAYQWDASAAAGQRIDPGTITIGGTAVDPAASYVIAVSDGLRGPAGNPVIAAAPLITHGVVGVGGAHPGPLFDNLAAYLSTRNPLPVPALSRITRVSG